MNRTEQLQEELLDFAVDEAIDTSQGIYQDAIDLGNQIEFGEVSLGDAYVLFRELRERLDEARYDE